ncbi:MAG TPA: bifunctional demethylmenaquinone methyltransferase/2-methoxy-6-polyprenyl-1,4-benzoquinol methylase UbiE [Chitinophagaceae bacterium]|nr:bifunctional demethylmenaquinone methyltransferase/2-methoxy-6-polyprenyl-1,4-benzoquinol methylase UbiE [Chitinophagaceae bacterium]
MNNQFPHDEIKPFVSDKAKKQQVEEMFDSIAGRYDLMNRLFSAGVDMKWRKKTIALLKKLRPKTVLDMATGTADMAILTCRLLEPEKVIGLDLSTEMLGLGRKKIEKEGLANKIELLKGDGEAINFPDNSFDAVTVAFGVRNFENLENGLREMLRVLKPGGKLVVLEFSKPNWGFRNIYNLYMGIVAPEVARWFRQNKEAYRYLNRSSNAFPDRRDFTAILDRVGFSNTECKPLSFGICCIYSGRKS